MTERTKSFITLSELMFDLQKSKSNSPERALTFFLKKKKERERDRDRERLFFKATFYTKRVWYSHVLNANLSQVLQKKKLKVLNFSLKTGLLN